MFPGLRFVLCGDAMGWRVEFLGLRRLRRKPNLGYVFWIMMALILPLPVFGFFMGSRSVNLAVLAYYVSWMILVYRPVIRRCPS